MKLPSQTLGPITLSRIDYSPRMSQETPCFVADIAVGDLRGTVENAGHGGDNVIRPYDVHQAVSAYAKTLPPRKYSFEGAGDETYAPTYDSLIASMLDSAIEAHDRAKYAKKGFTHMTRIGDRRIYTVGAPSDAMIAKARGNRVGTPEIVLLKA